MINKIIPVLLLHVGIAIRECNLGVVVLCLVLVRAVPRSLPPNFFGLEVVDVLDLLSLLPHERLLQTAAFTFPM